jgi:hypothetical protein
MKLILTFAAIALAFVMSATAALASKERWVLSMNKCDPKQAEWTLHGLWPQKMECGGPRFNVTALDHIRDDLNKYWGSCKGPSANPSFWEHEWTKHGTCTGLSLEGYFESTLALLFEHRGVCKDSYVIPMAPGVQYEVPNHECRVCINDELKPC